MKVFHKIPILLLLLMVTSSQAGIGRWFSKHIADPISSAASSGTHSLLEAGRDVGTWVDNNVVEPTVEFGRMVGHKAMNFGRGTWDVAVDVTSCATSPSCIARNINRAGSYVEAGVDYLSGDSKDQGLEDYLNYIQNNASKYQFAEGEDWDTVGVVYDPSEIASTVNIQNAVRLTNGVIPAINPVMSLSFNFSESDESTIKDLYSADVFVVKGDGDDLPLNKPLVVGDGFDPFDERNVTTILTVDSQMVRFANLFRTGQRGVNGYISPLEMGYDLVFINFKQGGGDLKMNAKLMLKALELIEQQTAARYMVAGVSMGGVVARLALLMSQPAWNTTHGQLAQNAKGFLSIDAPQQGASIGSLQHTIFSLMIDAELNAALDAKNQVNPLVSTYAKLNVPAAHQMLYGHHQIGLGSKYDVTMGPVLFALGASPIVSAIGNEVIGYAANSFEKDAYGTMAQSVVQMNFYAKLLEMGGYRDGIPMDAIAYSNFYRPNENLNPLTSNSVIRIIAGNNQATVARRTVAAGSDGYFYNMHELMPGSTGDWFFTAVKSGDYPSTSEATYVGLTSGESFKGTFIPIYSALDLDLTPEQILDPAVDKSELALTEHSKFDRVFYMHNVDNGYRRAVSGLASDNKRYEHMVFDTQLMSSVEAALKDLERRDYKKQNPFLLFLLRPRTLVDAGLPGTPVQFSTKQEFAYNITSIPSWAPRTITVQILPIDGKPMTGTIVVEGVTYNLSGWVTEVKVASVGQPNILFKVNSLDKNRTYMINWWADNSEPPPATYGQASSGSSTGSDPEVPAPVVAACNGINAPVEFSVANAAGVQLTQFPTWPYNKLIVSIQPTDGSSLTGSITLLGQKYNLTGWYQQIEIAKPAGSEILATVNTSSARTYKMQYWAQ